MWLAAAISACDEAEVPRLRPQETPTWDDDDGEVVVAPPNEAPPPPAATEEALLLAREVASHTLSLGYPGDGFGRDVDGGADYDGDGRPDIVIGGSGDAHWTGLVALWMSSRPENAIGVRRPRAS